MKTNDYSTVNATLTKLMLVILPLVLLLSSASYAQVKTEETICCNKEKNDAFLKFMPSRPSSSRVHEADRYVELTKRIDKLDTGNCVNAYHLHKAQAWLNFSRDLYHEGDGAAAVYAAYDEAEKLIKSLEEGKTPPNDTVMIQFAAKLRPDLWAIADSRKSSVASLSNAAREVAYCEVYLVRAGHAQTNLGGNARVDPLLAMAQDICVAINDKPPCTATVSPALSVELVASIPAVVQDAKPQHKAAATFTLSADALFDVNKSTVKEQGKAKIDAMLISLQSANYSKIVVVGHTDSDGSDTFNQSLSVRRALAVKSYLVAKGVNTSLIETGGMGEKQPIASNTTAQGKALNRRVEIEVVNVRK
jgi:outer membrane protein OmpA-like peptidoglycan-associated protein